MSIEFKIGEDAIFAALHAHVATLANTEGKHVSIKLKAGRGKNGYSATVTVGDAADGSVEPVARAAFLPTKENKTSTTTTTRGYEEVSMQRAAAPVETVDPEPSPAAEEIGPEVAAEPVVSVDPDTTGAEQAEERPSLFQRK